MTRRRRLLCAAAALSLAVAPAATAAAPHAGKGPPGPDRLRPLSDPSPYLVNLAAQIPGAQWLAGPWREHFHNARDTGADAAFVPVAWSDIEKVPGIYDTAGLDELVVAAHDDGIDLVLQLQTTGEWSVPTPASLAATEGRRVNSLHPEPGITAAPTVIDAAVPFWQAMVRRYHPGGDLARERGWRDGWGVRSWEAENEPDFSVWPGGSWQNVTKDYALFLSHVTTAVHQIDRQLLVAAPALSGVEPLPGSGNTSTAWLRNLLSTDPASMEYASDDYRAAVAAGAKVIGAAPYIDVYSFHCDFGNGVHGELTQRADDVRRSIQAFSHQKSAPTPANPRMWCTEGAETAYDASDDSKKHRFAWAQMQLAAEQLGAGVERFNFDFGIQGGDTGATWQADPIRPATIAMTTYFPSGHGVVQTSETTTKAAGQPVFSYAFTNPATGLTATILWAPNADAGSGTEGPTFSAPVPVSTGRALLIDPRDWSRRVVAATDGVVRVPLNVGDPSPPWIVSELRD